MVLGGAGIVTAPSVHAAQLMADASRKLSHEELVDEGRLREVLPVLDVLGPASSSISTGWTSFLRMEAPLSRR